VRIPRSRWLLLVCMAPLLVSCGTECDRCEQDSDCKQGFLCVTFEDGSKRCGSGVGATTCRVR
jgi:hypothetical protein